MPHTSSSGRSHRQAATAFHCLILTFIVTLLGTAVMLGRGRVLSRMQIYDCERRWPGFGRSTICMAWIVLLPRDTITRGATDGTLCCWG